MYSYETTVAGQRQYRIRLGFFATGPEAEEAGRALAAAAGLSEARIGKPWAVRPSLGEELGYGGAR
jgi:septal ring-binding cell division protein DamX